MTLVFMVRTLVNDLGGRGGNLSGQLRMTLVVVGADFGGQFRTTLVGLRRTC